MGMGITLATLVDGLIFNAVKRSRHHTRLRRRMKSTINTSTSTIARYQCRLLLSLFRKL